MRRIALLSTLLALAAPAAATAAPLDRAVSRELSRGGGVSGAYVLNTTTGQLLASVRADTARIPASVEKLYTTSTALLRFGADGTLDTSVLGDGTLDPETGVYSGDLYLRGSGDPTFGSARYTQYAFGGGATVTDLATALAEAGITRVTGRVYGDESRFDLKRGGPASSYGYDMWIGGPLSSLLYNRGLASESGGAIQKTPAQFAAQQLTSALKTAGVRVARPAAAGAAPVDAQELASVPSLPMETLARLTLVPSDNLLAEMLLKTVGAHFGASGSTTSGAAVVRSTVARFGIKPRISDGSGLSRANSTTPRQVVRLLAGMRDQPGFRAGLPVAGRTGTLARRMRGTVAQDRCQAKTGTLSNVSALGGYCTTANGHEIAFAFMFNRASTGYAKAAEDRLTQLIARQRPVGSATRAPRQAAKPAVRAAPTTTATRGGGAGTAVR